MKLMHVDASAKGDWSNSRTLSRFFIEQLREQGVDLTVDYLDLNIDTPPHVTEAFAAATYTHPDARTDEMKQTLAASDALCKRVMDADACLFAMPMYNWSMPSTFKTFIDSITRTELTYLNTPEGIVGQLTRQKVLFLTSRGADLRPGNPMAWMDALTPALKAAFAFIGVQDPQFVDAQPLLFSAAEARLEALERARMELAQVARQWAQPA
ncbi:FMN-dependent NADH-azoreductase [Pseudomonas vanderleydeniana]|uniref:FMN dependent NADH:quinone oxidoreductase n=1 Tax=Pseudomonas vanderleydeniana TaxID=2745495 RepID=A0A9E6PGF0_9PSED|nr:NAD(P)H-dependent oxidoreductase [Pseudomonas vanderleydeniana]QXI25922.1 NAD(P)H-dependent oxidoreductase [Pseudomonas vanderleydeniana]